MAMHSVVAPQNVSAAQVSQGFSSQFQSTLLTGNKIIGRGGREGVSKGADSKNVDQTNFYKVRSHMNRGQMIAAVSNTLHVIVWSSEDKSGTNVRNHYVIRNIKGSLVVNCK